MPWVSLLLTPVKSFVQSFFLMNLTSFHLVMNQQAKLCAAQPSEGQHLTAQSNFFSDLWLCKP
jgi:hypothetical protein